MASINQVKVKFYFYQVKRGTEAQGVFPGILKKVQEMPLEKREKVIYGDSRFLTDETIDDEGCSAFLLTKKRTRAIPQKIKGDGSRESLNLTENEGLGEDVAIAFDATGTIAAIQSNRYSMGETTIAQYINKVCPNAYVSFVPIINLDSMERIRQARQLRKLHVKLAAHCNINDLKDCGMSVSDALSLQYFLSSPHLEVTWSVGREKEGLGKKFWEWIPIFKKYHDKNGTGILEALDVVIQQGEEKDMESIAIDLLADRLCYEADVDMTSSREIDQKGLMQAACAALTGYDHELKSCSACLQKNN